MMAVCVVARRDDGDCVERAWSLRMELTLFLNVPYMYMYYNRHSFPGGEG
jgi:hypothetical protein